MDQHRHPSLVRRSALGLALLALVLGGIGLLALPADAPSAPAASYASLQQALQDGRGKGFDKGSFEVWASISPTPKVPTAWVWVVDDTSDGDGVEIWAYSPDYVHPGPDEDAVQTFHHHDVDHLSVQDFVDWIVEKNPDVDPKSLLLVENAVSVLDE